MNRCSSANRFFFSQALSSLPVGLYELLRALHVHGLKNDEVLLLKDQRRLPENKDAVPPGVGVTSV